MILKTSGTKDIMMWFTMVFFLVAYTSAQMVSQAGDKCSRDFVCPPQYIRLNQNCYYFSKNKTTWQNAFFDCQDLHGKFVIVKNPYQDKSLRNFLNKISIVSEERWIGGMYDWEQMIWKWGASGKEILYKGFSKIDPDDKEKLKWHCIALDPVLQYKWGARSCLESKHYICQTKIKRIERKNIRKYHTDKYSNLNEVLSVPLVTDYDHNKLIKEHSSNSYNDVLGSAAFANRNESVIYKRKLIKRRDQYCSCDCEPRIIRNGTEIHMPQLKFGRRRRRNKIKDFENEKDTSVENIHTQIYYSGIPNSPLHPRVLTEELSFP